jgi:hypothetical protein
MVGSSGGKSTNGLIDGSGAGVSGIITPIGSSDVVVISSAVVLRVWSA